jgi:8-amino-7-oxononanoate synthase
MNPLDVWRVAEEKALAALRQAGLLRRLRLPQGIDLVSDDFLGLASHSQLIDAMRAALPGLGAGAGGSRLLRGHDRAFERIEVRLAAFCDTEAALLFATGYAANQGLLQTLAGPDDLVLSDERNHASIVDGIRLSGAREVVYPHQDLEAVEHALRAPRGGRAFLVTESVFGMDGDLSPLAALVALAEAQGALVVVDEAHATGLYGTRGSGRVEELGLRERVLATVHTGGKALGSGGAWVAGPRVLRDRLVNHARTFMHSTAPLPVLTAALEAGLDLVQREPHRRQEVHRKAALLRRELAAAGLPAGGEAPIVPIVVGDPAVALALQDGLAAAGFDARAVRPPTVPDGTARLRVTARYPVADGDLMRFARELARLPRVAAPPAPEPSPEPPQALGLALPSSD